MSKLKGITMEARIMEATDKNAETVNEIISILHKKGYTVQEAHSILDYTKGRIKYTSKVGENHKLNFPSALKKNLNMEFKASSAFKKVLKETKKR